MVDRRPRLRDLVTVRLIRQAHWHGVDLPRLLEALLANGRARRYCRVSLADQRILRRRWATTAHRWGYADARTLFCALELTHPDGSVAGPEAPTPASVSDEEHTRRLAQVRARVQQHGHPDFR